MDVNAWTKQVAEAQKEPAFLLMLWINGDLAKEFDDHMSVFVGFYISLCNLLPAQVRDNPHVLGGYMRRMMRTPPQAADVLAEAFTTWRTT
jgi:hypothetical protein